MGQVNPDFYRLILESLPLAVFAADRDGKIIFWNEETEKITGYLRQDVLGHSCNDEFLEHADSNNNPLLGNAIPLIKSVREGRGDRGRFSVRAKSGQFIAVKMRTLPFRNEMGSVRGAIEIIEEAAPPVLNERRANRLAAYGCLDTATGVLNRGMIEAYLHQSLGIYAKHPVPFCVICVAIDDIFNIQERFGQAAVDAVLRATAQTIQSGVRPTDYLGRWSDLELLAILNVCNETDVITVGDRLRKLVHFSGINWWGDSLHITISIGATPAHDHDRVETIVARAQQALKKSSQPPGNCMVVINKDS